MKCILLLFLLFISCKKPQNAEVKEDFVNLEKEILIDQADSILKPVKFVIKDSILKNYNRIYAAYDFDSSDTFSQTLAVNWITNDSIEYLIDYENQLCEGFCNGVAVHKYGNEELEKDENIEEGSYFVKYSEKKEDLLIVILIEAEKKGKAKAIIYEGNYASECSPYEFIMTIQE